MNNKIADYLKQFTPSTVLDKFEKVQPMSEEQFKALKELDKNKKWIGWCWRKPK